VDRVAVISGGAGGIGRAVVARLAADGFFPVILDRDEKTGEDSVAGLRYLGATGVFFRVDLTRHFQVQEVFAKIAADYQTIDVLVNLAGGTLHAKLIQDFSLEEWQEVIDTNLKATFFCCQAVLAMMTSRRKGVIVNTSSNYGVTGSARRTAYSAAKAGVIGFSKSLARELAPFGIRVNVIAPGRTATPRVMGHYAPDAWAEAQKNIPMGRAADPSEIAEGVAFLASDESGYITGQTLHVNGGMVMP
jgi:NAD(P)-dependent dehydrogenase (short-subunit alcohol dehydrogenase family)